LIEWGTVMDDELSFQKECLKEIEKMNASTELIEISRQWMIETCRSKYSYNFRWGGRPIIQYPQDIVTMQEIIAEVRPDLIIETGVARGGSAVFYASMLAQLDLEDAIRDGVTMAPAQSNRKVVAIDIDIREHNREKIEKHPMFSRIQLIEGSSTSPEVVNQIKSIVEQHKVVLVCLDSNHTHEHVKRELDAYSSFVSLNSYCVVFDTIVEYLINLRLITHEMKGTS